MSKFAECVLLASVVIDIVCVPQLVLTFLETSSFRYLTNCGCLCRRLKLFWNVRCKWHKDCVLKHALSSVPLHDISPGDHFMCSEQGTGKHHYELCLGCSASLFWELAAQGQCNQRCLWTTDLGYVKSGNIQAILATFPTNRPYLLIWNTATRLHVRSCLTMRVRLILLKWSDAADVRMTFTH